MFLPLQLFSQKFFVPTLARAVVDLSQVRRVVDVVIVIDVVDVVDVDVVVVIIVVAGTCPNFIRWTFLKCFLQRKFVILVRKVQIMLTTIVTKLNFSFASLTKTEWRVEGITRKLICSFCFLVWGRDQNWQERDNGETRYLSGCSENKATKEPEWESFAQKNNLTKVFWVKNTETETERSHGLNTSEPHLYKLSKDKVDWV